MQQDDIASRGKDIRKEMQTGEPEDVRRASEEAGAEVARKMTGALRTAEEKTAEVPDRMHERIDTAKQKAQETKESGPIQDIKERAKAIAESSKGVAQQAKEQSQDAKQEMKGSQGGS